MDIDTDRAIANNLGLVPIALTLKSTSDRDRVLNSLLEQNKFPTRTMKKSELIDLASHYGFDLIYTENHPDYRDRKAGVYILTDRRSGKLHCTYSTITQMSKYIQKFTQ